MTISFTESRARVRAEAAARKNREPVAEPPVTQVRCVAEWLGQPPEGGLRVGAPVVCPYEEMVVRALAERRRGWHGEPGNELLVWLGPDVFDPGTVFRVTAEFFGKDVKWPSGTVYSAAGPVTAFEASSRSLEEALDLLTDYAAGPLGISRDHRREGAWLCLVNSPGRDLVKVKATDGDIEQAAARLRAEALDRFGPQTIPAGPLPAEGWVRYRTEWVAGLDELGGVAECDAVPVPARPLTVRRIEDGAASIPTHAWWVSTMSENESYREAVGPPSGPETLAETGVGTVTPGATFSLAGGVRAGLPKQSESIEIPDETVESLDEALDAIVGWAATVAAWTLQDETRPDTLTGNIRLYAHEPDRDSPRLLAKAGTGGSKGIDALLDMLEELTDAVEQTHGPKHGRAGT